MKTILVLTDFSINASYTAQYALELAQSIKANLLLCNVYKAVPGEKSTGKVGWSMGRAEEDSVEDLGALMAQLKTRMDKDMNPAKFRPRIDQCSKEGLLSDKLDDIAADRQILMAVISMHSAGALTTLLSGNNASKVIEKAKFPVLVIPYQVRYQPYKTIAFASAMNYTDIGVLQSLSGLAGYSGSDILIAHVDPAKTEDNATLRQFFNQIPLKINYLKVLYQNIQHGSIINNLKMLIARVDIDLLVLVHRKPNFLRRFLNTSVVQQLALHPGKPLLIFPCAALMETQPVF